MQQIHSKICLVISLFPPKKKTITANLTIESGESGPVGLIAIISRPFFGGVHVKCRTDKVPIMQDLGEATGRASTQTMATKDQFISQGLKEMPRLVWRKSQIVAFFAISHTKIDMCSCLVVLEYLENRYSAPKVIPN